MTPTWDAAPMIANPQGVMPIAGPSTGVPQKRKQAHSKRK